MKNNFFKLASFILIILFVVFAVVLFYFKNADYSLEKEIIIESEAQEINAVDDNLSHNSEIKADIIEEKKEISEEIEKEPQLENGQEATAILKEETDNLPKPDLEIGILSDAHAGQENGFSYLSSAVYSLENNSKANFILDLGDLVENRKDYKRISKKSAEADLIRANSIVSRSFKLYTTLGNHDVYSLKKDEVEKISGEENNYAFFSNDYQIIVLDSNYAKSGNNIDEEEKEGIVYRGSIPENEKDWLKDKLKKSGKNIIFIHHPLYSLENSDEIRELVKDYKERILFIANGHRHPESIRKSVFGGVDNYGIPSAHYQRTYVVVKIFGKEVFLSAKKF